MAILTVDSQGFLIPAAARERIRSPWNQVTDRLTTMYASRFGEALHSVYVRGSVATGEAQEGLSDVDTFCVVNGACVELDPAWIADVSADLQTRFPFQCGVEMESISLLDILGPQPDTARRFVLKSQSACIWGMDLSPLLPKVRLDRGAVLHAWDLENDLQIFEATIGSETEAEVIRRFGRWIAKRMLRSAFELVMERERIYTRDLAACCLRFERHFAQEGPAMRQVLALALEPAGDVASYRPMIDSGRWLCDTVRTHFYPGHLSSDCQEETV
jgi:hypothetical protein